jgi:hypothetical protein
MINDASSFSVTIDSGTRNAIQWIAAKDRILIGTSGGEWRMSGHSNKPLTPTNYDIKPQTVWGSKDMQPLVLHEAVLFVDYVGKKLREMVWDGLDERYLSPDLLLLAEHLTRSGGITTMAYQRNPDSIIWATLGNGDLISCTYVREQDVVAWALHPIGLGSVVGDDIPSTTYYTPTVSSDYPLLRTTTAQDDPQLPHVTAISNAEELQAMENDLDGNYFLTGDIDASATTSWNSGSGFDPIGSSGSEFTGTFDGCNYTISNLYINRSGNRIGLFGAIDDPGKVVNVTLSSVDITATQGFYVGALAGYLDAGVSAGDILIQNCHSSGTITIAGTTFTQIGGLIGYANGDDNTERAEIYDCSSSCTITTTTTQLTDVGGLIGKTVDALVQNCYATGAITIPSGAYSDSVGGLIGYISDGVGADDGSQVTYCYATGNITGTDSMGGLVGDAAGAGYIRKCYATGNVTAHDEPGASSDALGGLVGGVSSTKEITDCYARGNVVLGTTGYTAGGCIGQHASGCSVTSCYSIGTVTPVDLLTTGGFGGNTNENDITDSYWDITTSEWATSDGGTGHITSWMKTKNNYPSTWDFTDIWYMTDTAVWRDSSNSNNMGANSVCVIPGTTEDEVWVTITRAINDNLVRYVERMKPRNWGTDQEDCFFVDSGLTYDGDATDTFAGLGHLEGETVAILGDGAVFPAQVVTNGALPSVLDQKVSVCHIGLPYTYKLKPMRFDQNVKGTSKGSIKKAARMVISFIRTLNARYGNDTTTKAIDWRGTEPYTTPPDLFTGDKKVILDVGYDVDDPAMITGSDPLPATIRCLIPHNIVTGD